MITKKDITIEWRTPAEQQSLFDAKKTKDEPLGFDLCIASMPTLYTKTTLNTRNLGRDVNQLINARLTVEGNLKTQLLRHVYDNVWKQFGAIGELREFMLTHLAGRVPVDAIDEKLKPILEMFEPLR